MTEFELRILDFIGDNLSCDIADPVMIFVSRLGNGGFVWILLALILIIVPKTRRVGMIVALSIIIEAVACNLILKPLVARTRPYDINTAIQLLIAEQADYSFPSGHTGAAFAAAAGVLFAGGSRKIWIPAGILAILMAFSRLYLYVHYPSDVIAGIIIGIASAYFAAYIFGRLSGNDRTNSGIC